MISLIHPTIPEVILTIEAYGVGHVAWWIIFRLDNFVLKRVKTERDHIIRAHIKDGHKQPLRHCTDADCISLRDSTSQSERQVQT